MLKYPDRITGVVIQNTPAFGEPIDGPLWAAELAYWKDGSLEHRNAVRSKLTPEAIRNQSGRYPIEGAIRHACNSKTS
jgi:hypothetical protein